MAACNFSIPFSGSATDIYNRAKSSVQGQGGTFNGDENGGTFSVTVFGNTIAGCYSVTAQNMDIIIDTKPFLIPCSTIEGFLKNAIGV
jgi:hypothetical protein